MRGLDYRKVSSSLFSPRFSDCCEGAKNEGTVITVLSLFYHIPSEALPPILTNSHQRGSVTVPSQGARQASFLSLMPNRSGSRKTSVSNLTRRRRW